MKAIESGYDHNTICTSMCTIVKMVLNLRNQLNTKTKLKVEFSYDWDILNLGIDIKEFK